MQTFDNFLFYLFLFLFNKVGTMKSRRKNSTIFCFQFRISTKKKKKNDVPLFLLLVGYILDADWQERKYTGVGGGEYAKKTEQRREEVERSSRKEGEG